MKLSEIFEGWVNVAFKKEEVETIAKKRVEACNSCPSKKNNSVYDYCGECHCPLIAKIRSLENNCPLGKWEIFKD